MTKRRRRNARTVAGQGGLIDGALAKALAHPTRAEILAFLTEHETASPAQMTRAGIGKNSRAGDPERRKLANVSYHVRVLDELGLVSLASTRPVRGSTEHFYKTTTRMLLTLDDWSKLPEGAKNDVSIAALEETFGLAGKAVSDGTFDSLDERAIMNLTLRLDLEAFRQLAEEMTDLALKRCDELQAEAVGRVQGDLSQLMYASASFLLYESPPPKRPK